MIDFQFFPLVSISFNWFLSPFLIYDKKGEKIYAWEKIYELFSIEEILSYLVLWYSRDFEIFGIREIYELESYNLTTCYYLYFIFVCLTLFHTYLVVGGMDRCWYVYAWSFIFHIYTYMHMMTWFEIVTFFSHK